MVSFWGPWSFLIPLFSGLWTGWEKGRVLGVLIGLIVGGLVGIGGFRGFDVSSEWVFSEWVVRKFNPGEKEDSPLWQVLKGILAMFVFLAWFCLWYGGRMLLAMFGTETGIHYVVP